MLCDRCKKRPAKIYYTEIINGEKKEQYLCEECAAKQSNFQMQKIPGMEDSAIGSFLTSLLGSYYEKNVEGQKHPQMEARCKGCGIRYEDVLKGGKFGCAECYNSFRLMVERSLKQIQGANVHQGKRPKGYEIKNTQEEPMLEASRAENVRTEEENKEQTIKKEETNEEKIERLTAQLKEAVAAERYEDAARIRDEVHELKGESACQSGSKSKENAPM